MATGKSTFFYSLLVALASLAVGMVLASRLDLSPASAAQTVAAQAVGAPPMNTAPISGTIDATTFREIARRVSPAVVNIRTESERQAQDLSDFLGPVDPRGDLFEFFGPQGREFFAPQNPGDPQAPQQRPRTVRSAGSGFIIDTSGLILTNNHVVEDTTRIFVSLYGEDGEDEYAARIVGRDPLTDSALLELVDKPDHELPVVSFGDSTQMEPGDWVMAIGNPFGLAHTVSVGVISGNRPGELEVAPNRTANVLQTDAAINPGNSGGPLLNVRGEVIGINTAIYTDGRAGNMGIGFAIPSNAVRELLPQLRAGKVTRSRIGVTLLRAISREQAEYLGLGNRRGSVVESLTDASGAAARAGIESGDVIIAFNNQPVRNNNQLVEMVMNTKPGTTVPITIVRNGRERTLRITPDELDLDAEAVQSGLRPRPEPPQAPQQTSRSFGITIQDVTPRIARELRLEPDQAGAVITAVEPESPAARVQLRVRDVIIQIGNENVASIADAERLLRAVPEGGTTSIRYLRGGVERFALLRRE